MSMTLCPCGSKNETIKCCLPLIQGIKKAKGPEELMRSRYTAYVLGNIKYIMKTMRGKPKVTFNSKDVSKWAKSVKWERLEVIKAQEKLEYGIVEFKAYYREKGKLQCLWEISRFEVQGPRWFYVGKYNDGSEVV